MAAAAGVWLQRSINTHAGAEFQIVANRVYQEAVQRFRLPVYGLNGAAGLYISGKKVGRAQHRAYVEARGLTQEFAGVRGFGFIERVARRDAAAFIAAERADGEPQFAIRQLGDAKLNDTRNDDLYVVKHMEPAERNAGIIGLDVGSEARRRRGAERAVDTGAAIFSDVIMLEQADRQVPGLLLYLPVYASGARPSNAVDRRASLAGLLSAPIVIAELLDGLDDVEEGRVHFEVFDGGALNGTQIYDAGGYRARLAEGSIPTPRFQDIHAMLVTGVDLTLRISSTQKFEAGINDRVPWLLFAAGALISALLAMLLRQQASSRLRTQQKLDAALGQNNALLLNIEEEQQLAKRVLEGAIMASNVRPAALMKHLAPATTFNGDILLSAYSPGGDLHVLLGDFTGHGLAATIGALPVAETFRAMTAKGFLPPQILGEINRKLRVVLPTGRFLSGVLLRVDHGMQRISITNCGMPDAWLLRGSTVAASFPSTAVPLAVLREFDFAAAEVVYPVSSGDRVMLVSDGAIEAGNSSGEMLGAEALLAAVLRDVPLGQPLAAAVNAIDAFRGEVPFADDVSLVDVHLVEELLSASKEKTAAASHAVTVSHSAAVAHASTVPQTGGPGESGASADAGWRIMLELRGHALRDASPVPLLMSMLKELPGPAARSPLLFTTLAELYNNALDHGVLKLDSRLKAGDFARFLQLRETRLAEAEEGRVSIELDCGYHGENGRLQINVTDSGEGFDPAQVQKAGDSALHGRGLGLVRSLCESLEYEGAGNRARAVCRLQPEFARVE